MTSTMAQSTWIFNYDGELAPSTQRLVAIFCIFPALCTLFCAARSVLRLRSKMLGADDACALLGLGLNWVYSALAIEQTRWGLGLKPRDIPAENVRTFSILQYCGGPTYCFAILCFKLALLFGYVRMAPTRMRTWRNCLYGIMALVTTNCFIFACLLSFACRPVHKQWDLSAPGTCINQVGSYFALASTSLAFDLAILVLPFPVLARLLLDRPHKILVGVLFGLGFFITAIQVIRVIYIGSLADYVNSERLIVWSAIEINLGIILSCMPVFGGPLRRLLERRGWIAPPVDLRALSRPPAAPSAPIPPPDDASRTSRDNEWIVLDDLAVALVSHVLDEEVEPDAIPDPIFAPSADAHKVDVDQADLDLRRYAPRPRDDPPRRWRSGRLARRRVVSMDLGILRHREVTVEESEIESSE